MCLKEVPGVSLGKSLRLDVEKLVQDHREALTIEELQDFQLEHQQTNSFS